MGQGYSLTTLSAGSAGIDVPELSDMVYEKSLGSARFMKSIRARKRNGLAFVKVIMKPYPSMQLDPYVKTITRKSRILYIGMWLNTDLLSIGERELLASVPNALAYQRIIETSTSGYLVRQYIHSSLYDRLRCVTFWTNVDASLSLTNTVRDHFWKT
jgi:phosphoinositide-3-kinase regulatory subunit 4